MNFCLFLLHPVCFSALRLFCLALFLWLPVALSYVNLVRGRTLQTVGCRAALCGGEERLLHTQAALSPRWPWPCLVSGERSPQLCHLPEAVLLTGLQGGSAAGVAVDAVGLLSCVRLS